MLHIIKRPLVTEKNTQQTESGIFVFEVAKDASKKEIKETIQRMYRVKVVDVRTQICRSKVRMTRLGLAKKKYWKKALIKLAPGEKITLFEGA